jgi:putative exporter of polyketide antibiotics
LQLLAWAQDISPFTHMPKLPGAELTASASSV